MDDVITQPVELWRVDTDGSNERLVASYQPVINGGAGWPSSNGHYLVVNAAQGLVMFDFVEGTVQVVAASAEQDTVSSPLELNPVALSLLWEPGDNSFLYYTGLPPEGGELRRQTLPLGQPSEVLLAGAFEFDGRSIAPVFLQGKLNDNRLVANNREVIDVAQERTIELSYTNPDANGPITRPITGILDVKEDTIVFHAQCIADVCAEGGYGSVVGVGEYRSGENGMLQNVRHLSPVGQLMWAAERLDAHRFVARYDPRLGGNEWGSNLRTLVILDPAQPDEPIDITPWEGPEFWDQSFAIIDGNRAVVHRESEATGPELWLVTLDGSAEPVFLAKGAFPWFVEDSP
ncbi:MAG: hypothetical protein GYB68_08640 [Chloroflexi bacterium]|nr:hypothetical protein [Chloroflexota bacterium]